MLGPSGEVSTVGSNTIQLKGTSKTCLLTGNGVPGIMAVWHEVVRQP
ncbi:MAG: hypothetical protein HY319_04215 [Armatimonadetes bacterium]|nr:hypothetical protein [Armatimonadota bacterium]